GNFVGMVERGERLPSDDRLLQIAEVLELNGREMLGLKYQEARSTAAKVLLAPPAAEHPRLRRFLLESCENRERMELEFALGERTALERVVLQALLAYVFLPALEGDRFAPRSMRERVRGLLRKTPDEPLDPWVLEEEAEYFVPWARENLKSWDFDLPTLTLRIRHSEDPGDVSTLPLVDRELRDRMLASVGPSPAPRTRAPTLADLLADEGLAESDVQEIVDLVEFKKFRAQQGK
ncbi:MAG: hypothetical protein VX498_13325, partial [Myxococcota bacterium]|nr:hypothetical protein [Myxococcota bacterium]